MVFRRIKSGRTENAAVWAQLRSASAVRFAATDQVMDNLSRDPYGIVWAGLAHANVSSA
jgi:hypothetical protein